MRIATPTAPRLGPALLASLLLCACAGKPFSAHATAAPAGAAPASAAPVSTVRTLAGSGVPGVADGATGRATFLMPAAVAADASGHVYIADPAAQSIRAIGGTEVRTVAGGGPPIEGVRYVVQGSRDGRSADARFFSPSGLAVAKNGTLYIADTNNHAIRRIARDGTVTTFVRHLGLPRQLAFDREGNLYVADSVRGVLHISPTGAVNVVKLDTVSPFGVAVYEGRAGARLFVADARGLSVSRPDGNDRTRYLNAANAAPNAGAPVEGKETIGTPFQVVAFDDHTVAYTDPRSHCVRFLDLTNNITFVIAGRGDENAAFDAGAFADGPGASARFDAPMGIALLPNGSLVVADAGNRRIREISGFDRRQITRQPLDVLSEPHDPAQYRILYVGSSNVWWDTSWVASIPGIVEQAVASDVRTKLGRTAHVVPVQMLGASLPAFSSFISTIVDAHAADAVILQINDGSVTIENPGWERTTADALRRLRTKLAAAHVPLVVVTEPLVAELDPVERAWTKTVENAYLPSNPNAGRDWQTIAKSSGVRTVDVWAAFDDDLRSPQHQALYGSDDEHFSEHGRAVAGNAVGEALLRWRPWAARP